MAILETKNLKKIYGTGENAVHALRQGKPDSQER